MSNSHLQVATEVSEVTSYLQMFPEVDVVLTTNKRMVIKCPDFFIARSLRNNLTNLCHECTAMAGRIHPSNWYVQVSL